MFPFHFMDIIYFLYNLPFKNEALETEKKCMFIIQTNWFVLTRVKF